MIVSAFQFSARACFSPAEIAGAIDNHSSTEPVRRGGWLLFGLRSAAARTVCMPHSFGLDTSCYSRSFTRSGRRPPATPRCVKRDTAALQDTAPYTVLYRRLHTRCPMLSDLRANSFELEALVRADPPAPPHLSPALTVLSDFASAGSQLLLEKARDDAMRRPKGQNSGRCPATVAIGSFARRKPVWGRRKEQLVAVPNNTYSEEKIEKWRE